MSIAGLIVGTTSSVIKAPVATHRVMMSLRFEPMMNRSIGVPMRRAYQPDEHVAEVAGRHGERALAPDRDLTGHVVRDLGQDPAPVDRVHRAELQLVAKALVGEHRLHQVLAVVERPLDGDVVHVRLRRRSSSAGAARRSRVRPGAARRCRGCARPTQAAMAAEPVSPEVATTIVRRSPRRLELGVHQAGRRAGARRP